MKKFGDTRTEEQVAADMKVECEEMKKILAEYRAKNPEKIDADPYADYIADRDEAQEQY